MSQFDDDDEGNFAEKVKETWRIHNEG
jgi:hypothetical protein